MYGKENNKRIQNCAIIISRKDPEYNKFYEEKV